MRFFIQIRFSHNIKCHKTFQLCVPMNGDTKEKVGYASGRTTLRGAHPSSCLSKKKKNDHLTSTMSALTSALTGSLISDRYRFVSSLQLACMCRLENHSSPVLPHPALTLILHSEWCCVPILQRRELSRRGYQDQQVNNA